MSGIQKLWSKLEDFFATKDEAFTKTIGSIVDTSNTLTISLDIGFTPKCFEFIGIDNTDMYLRWDNANGWTGNEGALYDYDVDLGTNTITISAHIAVGKFIWRAFG